MIVVEHVSGSARLGAWWLHARRRLTTPRRRSGTASSMSPTVRRQPGSSSIVSQSESRTIEGRVVRGKREKARIAATQTTARDDLAEATARRKSECDRSAVSLPHESERLRRGAIDARKGRSPVVSRAGDRAPAITHGSERVPTGIASNCSSLRLSSREPQRFSFFRGGGPPRALSQKFSPPRVRCRIAQWGRRSHLKHVG
jgi:hypothetical protein